MLTTFWLILAMNPLSSNPAGAGSGVLKEPALAQADKKPRARDLGIPFDGTPGPLNAITDVQGIEVGHATLIAGEGKLDVGKGPVRTGVTAILPRGKAVDRTGFRRRLFAQRQRRHDGHSLGRGIRLSRRTAHDHQYP